jgi:hypothetical protein
MAQSILTVIFHPDIADIIYNYYGRCTTPRECEIKNYIERNYQCSRCRLNKDECKTPWRCGTRIFMRTHHHKHCVLAGQCIYCNEMVRCIKCNKGVIGRSLSVARHYKKCQCQFRCSCGPSVSWKIYRPYDFPHLFDWTRRST